MKGSPEISQENLAVAQRVTQAFMSGAKGLGIRPGWVNGDGEVLTREDIEELERQTFIVALGAFRSQKETTS